jgi:hypothetical protein
MLTPPQMAQAANLFALVPDLPWRWNMRQRPMTAAPRASRNGEKGLDAFAALPRAS